jgi:NADPH:quinone reductase-like Zn-dependent oxidoreductase
MSARRKVLAALVAVPALILAAGAAALSQDRPCQVREPASEGAPQMQAVVYGCYGGSEVLDVEAVARPVPAADEVLVRVRAASINPQEWHYMQGRPFFMRLSSGIGRPKVRRLGVDFAGTVESAGADVTRFQPGDAVFGARAGALAEYVTVREDRAIEPLPAGVTFAEAAGIAVAATTALQAVRDHGRVRDGQRVLINGASGGVGSYAVQIAKSYGAHVTGVSSGRNIELVQSLGADQVIDYTRGDFTRGTEQYDVIIDMVGNHRLRDLRRVLTPDGVVVVVSGPKDNRWLGPLTRSITAVAYSPFVSQRFVMFIADVRPADLRQLRDLMEAGQLRTVIDGRFPLGEIRAALDYLGRGRTRGKNVIIIGDSAAAEVEAHASALDAGRGSSFAFLRPQRSGLSTALGRLTPQAVRLSNLR